MLKVFVIYLHLKLYFFINMNTLANRVEELLLEVLKSRDDTSLINILRFSGCQIISSIRVIAYLKIRANRKKKR